MQQALQEYIESVKEVMSRYQNGVLETKEYLHSMQEFTKWLEEKCDENSRN